MTKAPDLQALIALADPQDEGAEISEALRKTLLAAVAHKAGPDAAALPELGPLIVRREGLPDWWGRRNLLLTAPGVTTAVGAGFGFSERISNVGVVGAGANLSRLSFPGRDGLIVVGADVDMPLANLSAMNGGMVVLGAGCTAASWARVDARNGGAVLVGEDGLWGGNVNLVSDDMHAIRELDSGRRTNGYGGRIVVGRHVWLSDEVRLVGGACVGQNSVIGYAANVRGAMPADAICEGSPARPVRHGVMWTREDLS